MPKMGKLYRKNFGSTRFGHGESQYHYPNLTQKESNRLNYIRGKENRHVSKKEFFEARYLQQLSNGQITRKQFQRHKRESFPHNKKHKRSYRRSPVDMEGSYFDFD